MNILCSKHNIVENMKKIPVDIFSVEATKCSPKVSKYDHISSVANPVSIDYYCSLGRSSNM